MGIEFKKVSHQYEGITDKYLAIKDIDLKINAKNEFIAICGQTGSGKSTAIQHMNALLLPTAGEMHIFDKIVTNKKNRKLNSIRKRVGLVFQFPEYQLFEETVLKDIMFGPLNFHIKKEEAKKKAKEIAAMLGIEDILNKSPFRLSGGQMRKVTIACILALEPDILILDEPTRGLDPQGRKEVLSIFEKINNELQKTIIVITHDMELVSEYAKRVVVLKEGEIVFDDKKEKLFSSLKFDSFHLDKPMVIKAREKINKELNIKLSENIFSLKDLLNELESKCG